MVGRWEERYGVPPAELLEYLLGGTERYSMTYLSGVAARRLIGITLLLLWFLAPTSFAATHNPVRASHPPKKAEALELLAAICPKGIRVHHLGSVTHPACSPCPHFTTVGELGQPSKDFFDLQTVIYGSFSAPGAQESVADFCGCENHASTPNFHASVFLRKTSDGYRMVDYIRTETSKCQLDPLPGGRDILVCQGFSGHAEESEEWIFSLQFLKDGGWRQTDLFGVANTWGACGPTDVEGSISRFDLLDLNHDGVPDLRITAKVGRSSHAGKLGVCAQNVTFTPAKVYRIDFLFKQGGFAVAPWSARTKETLDQEFKEAIRLALSP